MQSCRKCCASTEISEILLEGNFYSKVIFLNFCLRKCFYFFCFAEFELFMFHNNILKISVKNEPANLVKKFASELPTLQIST